MGESKIFGEAIMKNICECCGEETERNLVECPICHRKICWKCNCGIIYHPYKTFEYVDNVCVDCYNSWAKIYSKTASILIDAYKIIDSIIDKWRIDMREKFK